MADPGAVQCWVIVYPSEINEGKLVYTRMQYEPVNIGAGSPEVLISIARGNNLPVLAYPVFKSGPGAYPSGGLYPADSAYSVLELDWEDGFACEVLLRCILNSDTVQSFNTGRFRAAVNEKAAELSTDNDPDSLPGGVWLLDADKIVSRLGYGLFRESSINTVETMDFVIPAAAGDWFADNPFYPPLTSDSYLSVTVPLNRRTVFMNRDTGDAAAVFFDDSRWCWINYASGASECGRR